MPDGSQFVSISGRLTGNVEKKKKEIKTSQLSRKKYAQYLRIYWEMISSEVL